MNFEFRIRLQSQPRTSMLKSIYTIILYHKTYLKKTLLLLRVPNLSIARKSISQTCKQLWDKYSTSKTHFPCFASHIKPVLTHFNVCTEKKTFYECSLQSNCIFSFNYLFISVSTSYIC